MNVRKSDDSFEEFDIEKVRASICKAYEGIGEECNDLLLDSVANNLYLYDGVTTAEIRRQIEDALMSINKKVAKEYVNKYNDTVPRKKKQDFIKAYIHASNAASGSKFDANANVSMKNIVTLGHELYKEENIKQNRYILTDKIKHMYSKKLAEQYLADLDSHVLYKHDESGTPGYPYTYSSDELVTVTYRGKRLMLSMHALYDIVEEPEVLVDDVNVVYQKTPEDLMVLDDWKWTKVTKVTRKDRHRQMVVVTTRNGEDIVVTDNHPMIVNKSNVEDTIDASECLGCTQYLVSDKLTYEGVCKIDVADYVNGEGITVTDNWVLSENEAVKRYVDIDEELGYLVGSFFIAKYDLSNDKTYIINNIAPRVRGILIRKFNVFTHTSSDGGFSNNGIFLALLKSLFGYKQNDFRLPYNVLKFNNAFSLGCVEAVVDACAVVHENHVRLLFPTRELSLQCRVILNDMGYFTVSDGPDENGCWPLLFCVTKDTVPMKSSLVCKDFTNVKSIVVPESKNGQTTVSSVQTIDNENPWLKCMDVIYDITTESHTFNCSGFFAHNCVAITMYPFLVDGLKGLGGESIAPTDFKSFCGEFINMVYSVASQFMGAVATPEMLIVADYYLRKDYGDDYYNRIDEVVDLSRKKRTIGQVIDNGFQQIIHSINVPTGSRGYQTVFHNISYFDHYYFNGVFGDFRFPDGTAPQWESVSFLQKRFMKWFNKERLTYPFTFPVETMALLTDGNDGFLDEDYADFTAEMWSEGHSFFCYLSDSPDSLSSCCRLRNSLKDNEDIEHIHTTHQYSMGTASVATGSKSVMTMNLPRLVQNASRRYFDDEYGYTFESGQNIPDTGLEYDKDRLYEYIRDEVRSLTERVHKYQTAFNETIKDFLNANMLDVYRAGFIDMRKQYLTVGVNGITDAAEFVGIKVGVNDDYKEFVNNILETINISNRKDKTRDCMFNTEFVPAENLAVKNYKWDKKDGYWVSPNRNLYSSYFYNPEDSSLSVIDKMKLHGKDYVQYLDGGSACHENLSEHLSKEQYRKLLSIAAKNGCNYFTFNVKNTVCNDCGYISKDTLDKCPKCGSENLDYMTRVIGYLKRISSFSEARQDEAARRAYLNLD